MTVLHKRPVVSLTALDEVQTDISSSYKYFSFAALALLF